VTETAGTEQPTAFHQHRWALPPGATELVLVRHGQSEAYVDGSPFPLVDGHGDPPLSGQGREEARRVCARLAAEGVDAIYVTTLRRTAESAEPLARQLGLEARVEPGLREVYLGDWEGGEFRKRVAENHPISQRMRAEERWDVIPGAESSEALASRVRDAIVRLAAAHRGERAAAFTHGGVIGQALALAAESRPFAFIGAENASISRLVITEDRWIVRGFNDFTHLADMN
jgi:2,3-bisphosphoglycerate-dependent phosphoglycerate mutase